MGEDASLDDFLATGESEESAASEAEPSEPASEEELSEPESSDGIAPATTTYAWDGGGAACEACGEVVERRWQQDGGLVCVACKDWERA